MYHNAADAIVQVKPETSVSDGIGKVFVCPENESASCRFRGLWSTVLSILATVNLAGKYKNKINQLSGGEQQRVALARALVNKPTILLADEPTGNLDPNNSWEIMKLMEQINENGTTVIVVTHNREIVNAMKKRDCRQKMAWCFLR